MSSKVKCGASAPVVFLTSGQNVFIGGENKTNKYRKTVRGVCKWRMDDVLKALDEGGEFRFLHTAPFVFYILTRSVHESIHLKYLQPAGQEIYHFNDISKLWATLKDLSTLHLTITGLPGPLEEQTQVQ